MSKMNDMAMTIEELRNAAAAINDAADWLAQQFGGTAKARDERQRCDRSHAKSRSLFE